MSQFLSILEYTSINQKSDGNRFSAHRIDNLRTAYRILQNIPW